MTPAGSLLSESRETSDRPRRLKPPRKLAEVAIVVVIVLLVPNLLGGSAYDQLILELIAIYALAATGLGVAVGFTGQFQTAQPACMAVSAYLSAILALDHGWSAWLAMLIGVVAATACGAMLGLLTMRTRSHYLLLVTFGLQVIVVTLIGNLGVTGGVNGHAAIIQLPFPGGGLAGTSVDYSILTLGLAGAGMLAASWLGRSYLGIGMQGSRQSESAELSSGLSPARFRFLGVVLSAVYSGVAGAIIGPVLTFLVPDSFGLSLVLLFIVIVVTGGMNSPVGIVLAAIGLTWADQVAQGKTTAWPMVYGLLVMVILVVAPGGLASVGSGARRVWRTRLRSGRRSLAEAADPGASLGADRLLARFERDAAVQEGGPALNVSGVTRHFGGLAALDDVSLVVQTGSVHGLIGPNGSGKTTLFNVVSGFVRPQSGSLASFGVDIGDRSAHARGGANIGRTFQQPHLMEEGTVLENVLLGALRPMSLRSRLRTVDGRRRSRPASDEVAAEALELVGLAARANDVVGDLPYGERRLVDLARVLAAGSRLVLLDEPTSGVGATSVATVGKVIRWLSGQGVTVLLVEHDMRFVGELCDSVTVLSAGRVISEGAPAQVVADPAVIEAYLGTDDA